MSTEKAITSAHNALLGVMDACPGGRLLVICDDVRDDVGDIFARAGLGAGLYTRLITLETEDETLRREVPKFVREAIVGAGPGLAVTCLRGPADEVPFRIRLIRLITKDKNRRLGHGPGITLDMLTDGALALGVEDYDRMRSAAGRVIASTDGTETIHVTAPGGTDVEMSVRGRGFFTDVKITNEKWGNLPVGEVLVGPVENSLRGVLVCDLAVGGIGPIENPVKIECKDGTAVDVGCGDPGILSRVKGALATDDMASCVGEMAIGLNPLARIVEEFLESEKAMGTAHIAFGRNIDYPTGGRNNSANHMDFLIDKPTLVAFFPDGKGAEIVRGGEFSFKPL